MKKRKPVETEEQLLNALEELFCDVSEDEPIENIDTELREVGYDPNALGERLEGLAQRALADSPLNWRIRARQEIEAAKVKLDSYKNASGAQRPDRSSLVNAIQQLLKKMGYRDNQLIPAQFRNFETASDQDLFSLLQQLEYLSSEQDAQEE